MKPLLQDCLLAGPVFPVLILDSGSVPNTLSAICPVCSEVVYESTPIIQRHDFYNWGKEAMWYSRDMAQEVHRCGKTADWRIEELDTVKHAA